MISSTLTSLGISKVKAKCSIGQISANVTPKSKDLPSSFLILAQNTADIIFSRSSTEGISDLDLETKKKFSVFNNRLCNFLKTFGLKQNSYFYKLPTEFFFKLFLIFQE